MKSIGLRLAAVMLAATAVAEAAHAGTDWGSLSGTITMQSDYRYRGISQNSKEFAPQGAVDWSGPEGFYAGVWTSKVNWGGNNPSYELDIYGGKHFDLNGTDLNVEAYYYSYPDYNPMGGPAASYYETIVQLSHTFDKLTVTVTGANSPEWSLGGGVGWYTSGNVSYAVNDWLSISGTVGHQWVDAAPADYTHWDVGFTASWHSWSLDLRYVGNDIGNANCAAFWMGTPNACKANVMATLSYSISDLLK